MTPTTFTDLYCLKYCRILYKRSLAVWEKCEGVLGKFIYILETSTANKNKKNKYS